MEYNISYGPRTSTPKCLFTTTRDNYLRSQIQTPCFMDDNDEYCSDQCETVDEYRRHMIDEDFMFDRLSSQTCDYRQTTDSNENNSDKKCYKEKTIVESSTGNSYNRLDVYRMKTHQMETLFSRMKMRLHSMQSRIKRMNKNSTKQETFTNNKGVTTEPVTYVTCGVKHTAL